MYMRTTELLRLIPLLFLLLFGMAACNDADEMHLSPIQETVMEGDASTLQIDMPRTDWRIASVTDLNGYPPIGGTTELEGLGTVYYGWATIKREKENALTIEMQDNFDGEERGFIINLEMKTGFYKEQIVIHQKQCENFYRLESIEYSVDEGDGVEEIKPQYWGINITDHTTGNGETAKTSVWPFYNTYVFYGFHTVTDSPLVWTKPDEDIYVDMPKDLSNGEIIYETDKQKYSNWHQLFDHELKEKQFEVDIVNQKTNSYSADIYCRRLKLNYILTLARPNSDTKKVFKGILIKEYPYDCSSIRHEVSDIVD